MEFEWEFISMLPGQKNMKKNKENKNSKFYEWNPYLNSLATGRKKWFEYFVSIFLCLFWFIYCAQRTTF